MISTYQAIIFDLDGTLLDSISDIANCSNTVLERWGCPTHSVHRYAELVGDGISNLARKVLPSEMGVSGTIDKFITEYREEYRERWNETTTAYPGIQELLRNLDKRGIALAVLSNKRDDFTRVCVSSFFPDTPFKEVRGERPGVPIKPDPTSALDIARSLGVAPTNCLFVGDSEIDIATGLRAGMCSVGVLWGFRARSILEEAGCTNFISHPAELLSVT